MEGPTKQSSLLMTEHVRSVRSILMVSAKIDVIQGMTFSKHAFHSTLYWRDEEGFSCTWRKTMAGTQWLQFLCSLGCAVTSFIIRLGVEYDVSCLWGLRIRPGGVCFRSGSTRRACEVSFK